MKMLLQGLRHHAYLIEGDPEVVAPSVINFLGTELHFNTRGNPDFTIIEEESFLIDRARALTESQSTKPVGDSARIFIVTFSSITPEAQNALLKTLEEPSADTHFFFIVPTEEMLLPTVRSRVMKLSFDSELFPVAHQKSDEARDADIGEFLRSSLPERLKKIDLILKPKDKQLSARFLIDLEKFFTARLHKTPSQKDAVILEQILRAKRYLSLSGASQKMILEELALTLPKIS